MNAGNQTTVSTPPKKSRPTAAERHTAQVTANATKQSELKREAAARRLAREGAKTPS